MLRSRNGNVVLMLMMILTRRQGRAEDVVSGVYKQRLGDVTNGSVAQHGQVSVVEVDGRRAAAGFARRRRTTENRRRGRRGIGGGAVEGLDAVLMMLLLLLLLLVVVLKNRCWRSPERKHGPAGK